MAISFKSIVPCVASTVLLDVPASSHQRVDVVVQISVEGLLVEVPTIFKQVVFEMAEILVIELVTHYWYVLQSDPHKSRTVRSDSSEPGTSRNL